MSTTIKGTALITGASAGIGAIYADRLAHRGYDLILVARDKNRLAGLAQRLRSSTGRSVDTVAADLNDKTDLAKVEAILSTNADITLLVNNAGVGATAPLLDADVEKMDEMIRLNVGALTRLTYAAVPGFVGRGSGTVINISSIVAISPETLNGVYAGSKAFVLAFSLSLHHELADKGVRVQAVLPGATATDFWDIAGVPVHQLPAAIVMTADDMVDAALTGLDQGEVVTIPSLADKADWDRYEGARIAMSGKLSSAVPAPRYNARENVSTSKATAMSTR
ncbi:SDR family oxidoreductase [Bradyrhizobium sp. CIAT3101]|uniref:SDR family NAD(P)-dependent oxidoreductase n=1 Tax=Bradyrhizobium sp. CIAT3101 TaxID=439387 RepID=UPI0024B0545F|nr:SDR family oxidoreductase [Bradyrhizobium sp. CIAT3101]WFU82446.1 SDR family oxidoreductase [Bradyrhizobium sp. CIAT3101]